jgi:hypothetical protein
VLTFSFAVKAQIDAGAILHQIGFMLDFGAAVEEKTVLPCSIVC